MNVKILVVYHKPSTLVKNEVFSPILVGAATNDAKQYFEDTALFDDDVDNISNKNPLYNEMTAVYWAWKNYDKLGNPDYIGLNHYRRFFVFEKLKSPYQEAKDIDGKFFDRIKYSQENISSLLSEGDYIAPMPSSRQSVRLNYARAHRIEDLQLVEKIIADKYPQYLNAARSYLDGNKAYFHNMFVFDKETFFEYCEWMFDILFEFENASEFPPDRMFISERLTGIFLTKLEEDGKKGVFLPTLYLTGSKQPLKAAIAQTKENLRLKNSSMLYAFKPIILYFTPKFILRMRRSKNAK